MEEERIDTPVHTVNSNTSRRRPEDPDGVSGEDPTLPPIVLESPFHPGEPHLRKIATS
jgi:hypothetical protein